MKPYIHKNRIKIYHGNTLEVLREMDSASIDMVMTSPPYWGLRDYGHNGQIGLESTYQEYIDRLITIFDEVKRVIKDTGSCWINIGDSYAGSGGFDKKNYGGLSNNQQTIHQGRAICREIKAKSLIGIPERFVIAMTDAGWIRRNTIIWYKPSCMPASVTDRFTVDFEYLYFFTKKQKYYFEQQFEKYTKPLDRWGGDRLIAKGQSTWDEGTGQSSYRNRDMRPNKEGRNKRCVWKINSESYKEAHFATYPTALCYTPIKSCCPKNGTVLDIFMGSGTTLKVARDLGCKGIGIELNEDYIKMAIKRIGVDQKLLKLL